MSRPRVSILIPNYNNGRRSSRGGRRDFIDDLLRSLLGTLEDDPTPLEIIIADDGSTDDSLETCRRWAQRAWPGRREGQPFCRLIEREHCGVLSVVANLLTAEARGEFCCRLDGDIVINTPGWAAALCTIFEQGPPTLGIVGPKQLGSDGRVHSAGSWILHPRGHHHVAQGADRSTVTRTIEVDHVMGCFYCHRKAIWTEIGGYDESILRGQTVDFGLRARLAGWQTYSVPNIEFVHRHAERPPREAWVDSPEGIELTLERFRRKWGFDRLAPDLDAVAERYAGTPLLWNARVFGPSTPWPPPSDGPIDITNSMWSRYAGDAAFCDAINRRARVVEVIDAQVGPPRRLLQVNCRSGLLCHLLAQKGRSCIGIDLDPRAIDLASSVAAGERYPGEAPVYRVQTDPRRFPLDDGSVDTVLLFDVLETHPNPIGLLQEARRVLDRAGIVAIVARERTAVFDGESDALHAYRPHELVLQVQGSGCFEPLPIRPAPLIPATIALLARRREEVRRPNPRPTSSSVPQSLSPSVPSSP